MHHYGPNLGSLNLSVVEIKEKENITTTLWWSDRRQENNWVRVDIFMPYITSRYYNYYILLILFIGICFYTVILSKLILVQILPYR